MRVCMRAVPPARVAAYRFPTLPDLRERLQPGPRSAIRFNIDVIMSDRTLWGHVATSRPIGGLRPDPGRCWRGIWWRPVLGPDVKTFLRRFYTDPESGQLAAMDSTARFFSTNMKQFMLVRDRECRTPFCPAPARRADRSMIIPTAARPTWTSMAPVGVRQCNHTKQAPGWRVVNRPDGVIVTTTPTGHSYESPTAHTTRRRAPRPMDGPSPERTAEPHRRRTSMR